MSSEIRSLYDWVKGKKRGKWPVCPRHPKAEFEQNGFLHVAGGLNPVLICSECGYWVYDSTRWCGQGCAYCSHEGCVRHPSNSPSCGYSPDPVRCIENG